MKHCDSPLAGIVVCQDPPAVHSDMVKEMAFFAISPPLLSNSLLGLKSGENLSLNANGHAKFPSFGAILEFTRVNFSKSNFSSLTVTETDESQLSKQRYSRSLMFRNVKSSGFFTNIGSISCLVLGSSFDKFFGTLRLGLDLSTLKFSTQVLHRFHRLHWMDNGLV